MPKYKNGVEVKLKDAVCRNGIAQTGTVYSLVDGDEASINVMRNNGEVQKWAAAETLLTTDVGKPNAAPAPVAAAPVVPAPVAATEAPAPVEAAAETQHQQ